MKRKHDNGFPARDAIVAFIRANPGKIGTREIAREFGLKNADRVELKRTQVIEVKPPLLGDPMTCAHGNAERTRAVPEERKTEGEAWLPAAHGRLAA